MFDFISVPTRDHGSEFNGAYPLSTQASWPTPLETATFQTVLIQFALHQSPSLTPCT